MKIKISFELIRSTIIVLSISTVGALLFKLIGFSFTISFLLFFIFQYVLFSFIANIVNNFFIQKTKQKELDQLEKLSTLLECAYCGKQNIMTFFPDQTERSEFSCSSCKKKNAVNIQFVVARVTEFIDSNDPTGISLSKNI
jgi:hypothetical protein